MPTRTYEYQSDFARRYFYEGKAEGEAEAEGMVAGQICSLLTVLAARGFDVSTSVHRRITSCASFYQLETWIRRAVTTETLGELFDVGVTNACWPSSESTRVSMIELNCLGKRCPLPVIELARRIGAVEIGEVVRILADDPAAAIDIPAWCRMRGQSYVGSPAPSTYDVRRLS